MGSFVGEHSPSSQSLCKIHGNTDDSSSMIDIHRLGTSGKTKMRIRSPAIPIIASILLSSPVFGGEINCQSEFGSVKLKGNLVIAAPCTLKGTKVDGNVKIFAGGSLIAVGAVIDGNIKADTADFIDLQNTEVDGNVDLKEMVGDISFIRDSTIDGNLKLNKNRSRLKLLRNYIDKNLHVSKNRGGVVITDNVIDGNLHCEKNNPKPEGDNNMVSGKKTDQCSGLQAVSDAGGSGNNVDAEPSGGSGNNGGTGSSGGSENNGGTGSSGGSGSGGETVTPPFEINSGTGGGASIGPLLIAFLLVVGAVRLRRYGRQYLRCAPTAH